MTASFGLEPDERLTRQAPWTTREIAQQPALWRQVNDGLVTRQAQISAFLHPLLARPDLRIVLSGAGTSSFAGQILAPVLSRELGRRVDALATTDIVSNPRECLPEGTPTLLVSFARSGDSPESLAATQIAKQLLPDCSHLVLTCNSEGALYRHHQGCERSRVLLMPEDANDRAFAMTSSLTCMMLAALLTLGNVSPDPGGVLVGRLSSATYELLPKLAEEARRLADRNFHRVVYLGSGPLNGLARESALKLLELTAGRVVGYSDSPMGFRHGPKSVLDDATLVVVYVSNDPYTRQYDLDMIAELQGVLKPANIIAITARADDRLPKDGVWQIKGLDDMHDAALAIPFVVCAQMLALHFSLALGKTPDDPFPAHEVNRVVRGVRIHAL